MVYLYVSATNKKMKIVDESRQYTQLAETTECHKIAIYKDGGYTFFLIKYNKYGVIWDERTNQKGFYKEKVGI